VDQDFGSGAACERDGMKSIKSTAAKYGGSVTTDLKKNWFELRILIPLS